MSSKVANSFYVADATCSASDKWRSWLATAELQTRWQNSKRLRPRFQGFPIQPWLEEQEHTTYWNELLGLAVSDGTFWMSLFQTIFVSWYTLIGKTSVWASRIRSSFVFAFTMEKCVFKKKNLINNFAPISFFIKHFALPHYAPKMHARFWMWTTPTYLELGVTGLWMAGSFFEKGKHGLAHLGHAGNQFGFCGVWILGWEVISISWEKKAQVCTWDHIAS